MGATSEVLLIVAAFISGRVNIDRVRSADFVEAIAGSLINAIAVRPVCAASLAAAAQELLEESRFLPEVSDFLRIAREREGEMRRVLGHLDRLEEVARMARYLLEDREELEVAPCPHGLDDSLDYPLPNAQVGPTDYSSDLPESTDERV